ncbi:MAG: suppressor of fused domain protein [Dysgonamonadaceae bacterium]|jgi:hypothetical protein|nr:suppressor of fused domain protein [Dysgonamonadaceae bacterium]
MNFLNFLKKKKAKEYAQEEYDTDYELKMSGLEAVLGKSHNMVGHAIIPFEIGGSVDMYYFPNGIKGTGFATMELLDLDGKGTLPNRRGTYEFVAFTKLNYESGGEKGTQMPFSLIERKICRIFTGVGFYSREAVLNPGETCELPNGEGKENTCLIFDYYGDFFVGKRKHHLLLIMEIFRSEMEFAMKNGSAKLFELLKDKGIYPYSDLDREPVV